MKVRALTTAAVLSLLIVGCASRGGVEDPAVPVEDRGAAGAGAGTNQGLTEEEMAAQARAAAQRDSLQASELTDPASPLSQRVIYFDYDSSELQPSALEVVQAHGRFLGSNPQQRIIVEGHTDERGSREYNLALGERRSEAVKRILMLNGATAEQVESVSFGEEKPAELGQDEQAWQQNRRAELLYAQP